MFFIKTTDGMLMPCGPKQPGAVQTTMQELAAKGLASKVHCCNTYTDTIPLMVWLSISIVRK